MSSCGSLTASTNDKDPFESADKLWMPNINVISKFPLKHEAMALTICDSAKRVWQSKSWNQLESLSRDRIIYALCQCNCDISSSKLLPIKSSKYALLMSPSTSKESWTLKWTKCDHESCDQLLEFANKDLMVQYRDTTAMETVTRRSRYVGVRDYVIVKAAHCIEMNERMIIKLLFPVRGRWNMDRIDRWIWISSSSFFAVQCSRHHLL